MVFALARRLLPELQRWLSPPLFTCLWCSDPPRGRVCRPHAGPPETRLISVALRGGDRTRPYGRRSLTLGGTLPYGGGEPGSRQPEQYALDLGAIQIPALPAQRGGEDRPRRRP